MGLAKGLEVVDFNNFNKEVPMNQYYKLIYDVLRFGNDSDDRTGVGTLFVFGEMLKFDLQQGFPLLPGKHTSFRTIAAELLWFLSGSSNNEDLRAINGTDGDTIWEEWAANHTDEMSDEPFYEKGDLGPIYGEQWRAWESGYGDYIDQIAILIRGLRERPFSRRHIVSAWNPEYLPDETKTSLENIVNDKMALAPCHYSFQMNVRKLKDWERARLLDKEVLEEWRNEVNICHESEIEEIDKKYMELMDDKNIPKFAISCLVNLRSSDIFLGLPYNIASYALLTHMIGKVVNMIPDTLVVSIGNAHVYKNHINQSLELLSRDHTAHDLCELKIADKMRIDDFTLEDFEIIGYESYPSIKAEVAV